MGVSITEVLADIGYDISRPQDALWVISQTNNWYDLLEEADQTLARAEELTETEEDYDVL